MPKTTKNTTSTSNSNNGIIKTGYDPRNEPKGGGNGDGPGFLNLKDGEHCTVAILVDKDEIISIKQCAIWRSKGERSPVWTYSGENDPSHQLGIVPNYRAFLPVKDVKTGTVSVWAMSKTVHGQVLELSETIALKGAIVRIKRTGVEKQTKYAVTNTGQRATLKNTAEVNVIDLLGPLTPEGAQELIAKAYEYATYEEFLFHEKGIKPVKKTGGKKAADIQVEEEPEDELVLEDEEIFEVEEEEVEETIEDLEL